MFRLTLNSGKTLADAKTSHADVLCCDKCILVEQGNLKTATVKIENRSSLFNDLVKIVLHRRKRLVAKETLLRVGKDGDGKTGQLTDFSKDIEAVRRLTDCARSHGAVSIHAVALHDPHEICEHAAELLFHLRADFPQRVRIFSKLHPMADLIHASDTLLFGDLENLQNDVVAADINGSKCGILHIRFSSFFFKGYPKKPAPNTKRTF